jgi:hypothetical protein
MPRKHLNISVTPHLVDSTLCNGYLVVQIIKGYLVIQGIPKVPSGPRYPKGT